MVIIQPGLDKKRRIFNYTYLKYSILKQQSPLLTVISEDFST